MLAYVGQRLLRYAEERDLHLSWQALIFKMFLAVDLVAFLIQALDLQGDGGRESEVVEGRRPQVGDDPARIRDRRPDPFARGAAGIAAGKVERVSIRKAQL